MKLALSLIWELASNPNLITQKNINGCVLNLIEVYSFFTKYKYQSKVYIYINFKSKLLENFLLCSEYTNQAYNHLLEIKMDIESIHDKLLELQVDAYIDRCNFKDPRFEKKSMYYRFDKVNEIYTDDEIHLGKLHANNKAIIKDFIQRFLENLVKEKSEVSFWTQLKEMLHLYSSYQLNEKYIKKIEIFENLALNILEKKDYFFKKIFLFMETKAFESEVLYFKNIKMLSSRGENDYYLMDMQFMNIFNDIFCSQNFLILLYKIITSNVFINFKPEDSEEAEKFQQFLKENIKTESDLDPFFNRLIKFVKLPKDIRGITTHYLQIFINLTDVEFKTQLNEEDKLKVEYYLN